MRLNVGTDNRRGTIHDIMQGQNRRGNRYSETIPGSDRRSRLYVSITRESGSTLYVGLTGIVQMLIQKSTGIVRRILSID